MKLMSPYEIGLYNVCTFATNLRNNIGLGPLSAVCPVV